MSDQQKLVRVDIPTEGTLLGAFRAFRAFAEKLAASNGKKLDPEWYLDGPEDRPELYDFSDPPEPPETTETTEPSDNQT